MDASTVKKWIVFFAGILCAILIADACSTYVANAAGITGPGPAGRHVHPVRGHLLCRPVCTGKDIFDRLFRVREKINKPLRQREWVNVMIYSDRLQSLRPPCPGVTRRGAVQETSERAAPTPVMHQITSDPHGNPEISGPGLRTGSPGAHTVSRYRRLPVRL